ncbi:LysR family transcriptional regulator [Lysinibacillus sphaericus]|uniref:LysR family transcriptional regulator n=1 Tax=Lysinibacillus sphaericus TaxID=1421 RepID=UPI003CFEF91E
MNIRELEVFKTIADCKSFSKASEKLFIAQPSLTKTIQRLEKNLGVKLFDRSNRIFRLTDEGELVYEKAIIMLQQMKELSIELEDTTKNIHGHLRVGLPQIIGTFFFPQVAKAFSQAFSEVTIEIVEDGGLTIEKLVEKGEIDVAFVVIPTKSKELEEQLLFEAPFVACLPENHILQNEQSITLSQLQNDDWISFDSSFALSQVILESCCKENFVPNTVYKTTQWDLLMALVRNDLGVTILPSPLVKVHSQDLCIKRISSQYIPWKIGIVVKKNSYKTRALKAFLKTASNVILVNESYDEMG